MEEGKALPISKYFNIAISLPCRVLAISPCKEGMGQEAQSGILACFPCRGDTAVPSLAEKHPVSDLVLSRPCAAKQWGPG